jgi:hypothetical protein
MTRTRHAAALLLALLDGAAGAATITIVNNDDPGEGFNDATVVSPVGGNSATTLGAQRLAAFTYAATLWGAQITSPVTIKVDATMDVLTCSASSATLGSAGARTVHYNFPNAPYADTYYPQALANKIAGADLTATNDIQAYFNSTIGTTCAFPKTWYYGLDGNPGASELDFVTVVMHELGHGLGVQTYVTLSSGARFNGRDDVYMRFLEDHSLGLSWLNMSDAQRATSAVDTSDLHWTGSAVVAAGSILSAGRHAGGHVQMYAPAALAVGSSVSHWDTALSPNEMMEPSYTTALHDPSLARDLLGDIGWDFATTTTTSSSSTSTSSSSTSTFSSTTSSSSTTISTPASSSSSTTSASTSTSTVTTTTTSTSATTPSSTSTTTSTTVPQQQASACAPAPRECRTGASQHSSILLRDGAVDALKWKLVHGGRATADGIVDANGSLALCVYDASAASQPLLASTIPTTASCGAKPCWKSLANGSRRYKNKAGAPDGIVDVKLQVSGLGELDVLVKGKGPGLSMPALGLATPVRVQLVATTAAGTTCWESSFAGAQKNVAALFKANGS